MYCLVGSMAYRFNDIKTRNELADFLKIERKTLTNVLYHNRIEHYYRSFEIPKKNGGVRKIDAPQGTLRYIQRRLLKELYKYYDYYCKENEISHNISHAFERGKGIISNAFIHKNKKYIINVDLKDFFDSFHFGRVRGFFNKNKYFEFPIEVSTIIAQLVCYKGKLPQGAPTSPMITNLICNVLDYKLLSLAKKYKLDYTRYADDLTFSTNDKRIVEKYDEFINELKRVIIRNGFSINESKTRFIYKDSKQTVTGLVVNRKINVDRKFYKATRAMANSLYKNGEFYIEGELGSLNQLEGRFAFIDEIEHYNNIVSKKEYKKINSFNAKEKDYQKFLFYKYFYVNDKPLIVTEGKTDIRYIKAALKNLYEDYPSLIEKNDDGFDFKIAFLKRSKRLRYFFNFSLDGADAMKNLYRYFVNVDNNERFFSCFRSLEELSGMKPKNPVIFIFDNETKSKKPLKLFLDFIKKNNRDFSNGGYLKTDDKTNAYLVTHQLVKNERECEIEDLFDDTTREYQINGKSFTTESNFDIEKYYGKDHFSEYIINNYDSIDFSNFKPLLNGIVDAINDYKSDSVFIS